MEGFSTPVRKDNKQFNNLVIFDFESICVPTDELKPNKQQFGLGKTSYSSLLESGWWSHLFVQKRSTKLDNRSGKQLQTPGWEKWARDETKVSNFFLKAYKARKSKLFFSYEWFDNPIKLYFPNCKRMKPFSKKLETSTLQTKTSLIMRSWGRDGLIINKHWKISNQDWGCIWFG